MFSVQKIKSDPGRLADQLRGETMLTPALIRHVIADGCVRLPALTSAGKTTKIDRLVEVGTRHEILPLAILSAFLEAQMRRQFRKFKRHPVARSVATTSFD